MRLERTKYTQNFPNSNKDTKTCSVLGKTCE